ncbi:MAG: type I-C CRISPR-associated protein Cas8c/Csd1 [Lachnospiraceae bacterium]
MKPTNRFYILGLAPNASRLAVRFFLQDTFGGFAANLEKHQKRLEIVRPAFDDRNSLSIWSLLRETANPNSRDKKPPEPLVGALLRAVLMNALYPAELFAQTEIRLRAEHEVSRGKAAILKAYLLRNVVELNPDNHPYKEVLQVQLNETTTYLPYRLGRLFAVLEALQLKANPGINATIKDRYFNSACATPAVVFPALIRLAQNHLNKLDGGVKVYYDKMITGLFNTMDESYPVRLSLQDQGIFQIGYYHQKQKFFTKKEEQENV